MSDNLDSTTRTCKTCKQEHPATTEYFYAAKSGGNIYLRGTCIACYKAISKQEHARRFAEDPDKIRQQQRDWLADPEHYQVYRDSQKEWIHRNPEKVNAQARKWKIANPDKTKIINKKAGDKYYATHKHVRKAGKSRRRARELAAPGHHTAADILLQIASQTDKKGCLRCWWCGCAIIGAYHVDHRVALAKGGTNWPDNLVISCPTCNLSKHDKSAQEWAGRLI